MKNMQNQIERRKLRKKAMHGSVGFIELSKYFFEIQEATLTPENNLTLFPGSTRGETALYGACHGNASSGDGAEGNGGGEQSGF
jgi:hypothetical protein